MTSQRVQLWGLLVACSTLSSSIWAADPPPVSTTMAFTPRQKDVEYETPKQAEYAKCKVEVNGKPNGWVVTGPAGQVLRKFLDTDGDGKLDQWRYYNHGIEVYRDIDTNRNEKPDQYRWLNLGGSRWGVDANEDGRIDQWKVLSAAEATREAIRAMIAGDESALQALMINEDDLKSLGVNSQLATRLLESAADPGKKAKVILAKSKSMSPQSKWTRFDAQMPNTIPVDEGKSNADLQVYESAMAIVETPSKSDANGRFNAVQIGEIIRVGEVWKLTQVPQPIDETGTLTSAGGILMEPLIGSSSTATAGTTASPKVEKVLKDLAELEAKLTTPGQTPAQIKSLMTKRSALMKDALELAESDEERTSLMKQMIDGYVLAAQMGTYPEGARELKAIEADINKKSPKSSLLPYATYRALQADYYVNLQEAGDKQEKQADIQKGWLESLEEFVKKYPDADDSDDAMFTLGMQEEYQGRTKEAVEWYQQLIKAKPKSEVASRAQGALRRINLNGQTLALSGPGLTGGTVDLKSFKDKVVLIVFWASEFKICEDDVPQLRALYQDNKSKGFEIVGVALDFDKSTALPFIQKNKMTWPQIYQSAGPNQSSGLNSPIATSFGIISLPTMILVGKDGKVVSRNATITDIKSDLPELLKK